MLIDLAKDSLFQRLHFVLCPILSWIVILPDTPCQRGDCGDGGDGLHIILCPIFSLIVILLDAPCQRGGQDWPKGFHPKTRKVI